LERTVPAINSRIATALFVLAAAFAPAIHAQPRVHDGVLTDSSGRTLYVLDGEASSVGPWACTGTCLKLWSPVYAAQGAKARGAYSLVVREDGRKQWAYKGRPLYTWWNDSAPGDHDGDGLRGQAHVAKP
jgi:predicted lipoprotein with Yx(FWY)xxD motif